MLGKVIIKPDDQLTLGDVCTDLCKQIAEHRRQIEAAGGAAIAVSIIQAYYKEKSEVMA